MDRQALRTQLTGLVKQHLPKNVRAFSFRVYDGTPAENALTFFVDGGIVFFVQIGALLGLKPFVEQALVQGHIPERTAVSNLLI